MDVAESSMILNELPLDELLKLLSVASKKDSSKYCEELIRRFEPLIRKGWRSAGYPDEYRDFLHEVLLRLFSTLNKLREPKAFPGYFRRIVLSVVTDHFRRKQDMNSISVDSAQLEELVDAFDQDMSIPIIIRSCLELLPPREQEIVALEFIVGLTPSEIAERTGLSPGAVRMTKSRAIKRLRGILAYDLEAMK